MTSTTLLIIYLLVLFWNIFGVILMCDLDSKNRLNGITFYKKLFIMLIAGAPGIFTYLYIFIRKHILNFLRA